MKSLVAVEAQPLFTMGLVLSWRKEADVGFWLGLGGYGGWDCDRGFERGLQREVVLVGEGWVSGGGEFLLLEFGEADGVGE